MLGCSPSPNLGRILFFTTIFIFGLLIAVSVWNCVTYFTPDDSSSSTETSTLIEQPLAQDDEPQSQYAERGVGARSPSHIFPSPIFVPDVPTTWKLNATSDSNSIAFATNSSSVETSETMSLSNDQPTSPITVQPEPTSSEIAALAENLGSLLDGAVPLAAPSIIREATSEAQVLAVSVEAIATDIASIAGEVEASQLQAPNALKTAEGLLESLDAEVGSIAKDVTPTSGLPAPILDELSKAISSDLGDVVKVANGPVSLVGNLIEDNICETTIIVGNIPSTVVGLCGDMTSAIGGSAPASIMDSPTSSTQSPLTTEVSSSATLPTTINATLETTALTSFTLATSASLAGSSSTLPISSPRSASQTTSPISPSAAGSSSIETGNQGSKSAAGGSYLTTITRPSSTASAKPRIGTSSRVTTTGTDEIVTITESITVTEDCAAPPIRSVFLVGQTSTLTVYAYNACPTPSPCPECPSPTCHCPEAGGVPPTTSPPGGNGAQGPCPGSGYTCDDCLDGWFCPPPQTPAQSAPCGFGWPCVHCDGGWFCVPHPTQGPDTCSESSGPAPNSAGAITSTVTLPAASSRPSLTQPTGASPNHPRPRIPDRASGWDYCGCWADQPEQRALNMDSSLNLGPLTNADCVRHCIGRGFLMAGTENGSECYCGNFLNGTRKLDDSVCSIPCSGDPRQACGGSNALCCYSPDGEAHGWASAGPQPLPVTVEPPEVVSIVVGGVAQSVVTEPVIVFPPPSGDMSQLISQFGKITQQPEGQMPSGVGVNSAPNGSGEPASGSPTNSPGAGGSNAPGHGTTQGPNSNGGAGPPTGNNGNPTESPSENPNSPSATGGGNSGTNPGSASNDHDSATSSQGSGAATSQGGGFTSTPGNGNGGAGPVTPGGGGTDIPPGGPNGQTQGTTSASYDETRGSTGNGGGQTSPLPGQGQGTAAPNPNGNPSGNSGSPGQTSPSNGQGTVTPHPTGNPTQMPSGGSQGTATPNPNSAGNGGAPSQAISPGQGQGTAAPNPPNSISGNGGNPNETPAGQGQGTTGPNPTGNPPGNGGGSGQISPSQGQGTQAPNPTNNGGVPNQSLGQGGSGPDPTPNQSNSGGIPSTCVPGSTDPICSGVNGGGPGSPLSEGATAPNPTNGGGRLCSFGSSDPSCTSIAGGGGSLTPASPSQGQGATPGSNGGGASGQGQQSTTPNPIGSAGTCTAGSADPACTAPNNGSPGGVAPGQSSLTAPNPSNGGATCTPGSTDPNCSSPSNGGNSVPNGPQSQGGSGGAGSPGTPTNAPASTNPPSNGGGNGPGGQGQGTWPNPGGSNGNNNPSTANPNPTSNPSGDGGTGPNSRESNGPNAQGQGTQSGPGGGNGNRSPSTPGSNPTYDPLSNGGQGPGAQSNPNGGAGGATPTIAGSNPTLNPAITNTQTGEGQSTTLGPNNGGEGPNAASANPQESSYTFPPGAVPYGSPPTIVMTTLVPVVVWKPDDGEGSTTTLSNEMGNQIEPSDTPELEFEKPPTTTTSTSMLADPRWQRIRPVAIW